jgi:hypothetical protein
MRILADLRLALPDWQTSLALMQEIEMFDGR